jgi:hypothetical protein
MAKIMTLSGTNEGIGAPQVGDCKTVCNTRTGRSAKLCFVGKSKKHRSGWQFVKGGGQRCK